MSVTRVETRPRNSLLLVMDPEGGAVPESMDGRSVAATESCLAFGTLSAADGPTHVDVVDCGDFDGLPEGSWIAWEGTLVTFTGQLALVDVMGGILATRQVGSRVAVRLAVNDDSEPDRVSVIVGS